MNPQEEATKNTTSPERLKELAQHHLTLQRLVAANPAAPADLLQELATSNDKTTQKAVAANPNTPTKILMKLGMKYPALLLENPIFALLQLENPNFILEMPQNTLMALIKLPTPPEYILTLATKRPELDLLLFLVNNLQTPKTILEKLITSKNKQVAQAAKLHLNWAQEISQPLPNNPQEVLSRFLRDIDFTHEKHEEIILGFLEAIPKFLIPFAGDSYKQWLTQSSKCNFFRIENYKIDPNPYTSIASLEILAQDCRWQVRCGVACNPYTPLNLLETFAQDHHWEVRCGVACNPHTPLKLLETLAQDRHWEVRLGVAQHPKPSAEILTTLSLDPVLAVRTCVAKNPHTPLTLLETLAKDSSESVRRYVAANPNITLILLKDLAKDSNEYVRFSVAENPSTPIAILETLAKDSCKEMRSGVARNRHTPASILETLAKDSCEQVRFNVAYNPSTPASILETLAKDSSGQLRELVAQNPNTPAAILENLSNDTREQVRRYVAQNPNTPAAVLKNLSNDTSEQMRIYVAGNPHAPVIALETLAMDSAEQVRVRVANNHNTPKQIAVLALLNLTKEQKQIMIAALKQNPNYFNTDIIPVALSNCLTKSFSRLVVFLHPQTPPNILAKNAKSPQWMERYAIASNPNTPCETLKTLANDVNIFVRAAACQRMDNHMLQ